MNWGSVFPSRRKESRGEVWVTSSGDSGRIDDQVKKSDSAEKQAKIFPSKRQNENGVAPRSILWFNARETFTLRRTIAIASLASVANNPLQACTVDLQGMSYVHRHNWINCCPTNHFLSFLLFYDVCSDGLTAQLHLCFRTSSPLTPPLGLLNSLQSVMRCAAASAVGWCVQSWCAIQLHWLPVQQRITFELCTVAQ